MARTRADLLIERLRLDHRRLRALLQLMNETPEAADDRLERALVARDVMHYLHRHIDPAHHALEDRLLHAARGRDADFDSRSEALDVQHRECADAGRAILDALDRALVRADARSCGEPLAAIPGLSERMLQHLAYEEQHVFDELLRLLGEADIAAIPTPAADPLFDGAANSPYEALYDHYLHRVEKVHSHRSVLDSIPLDPLVEAMGLLAELSSVYAELMRRQRAERAAARRKHVREVRRARLHRKPLVAASAIGTECLRTLRHQREFLHETFVSPTGTIASVREFLHYLGRRLGRSFARR